jgi:hypothetical protein
MWRVNLLSETSSANKTITGVHYTQMLNGSARHLTASSEVLRTDVSTGHCIHIRGVSFADVLSNWGTRKASLATCQRNLVKSRMVCSCEFSSLSLTELVFVPQWRI